jgi:hypothetical protein
MTKWYIKLFKRLLNIAVLNCIVICRANSGQSKIDHLKFRVEMVQAQLIDMQAEVPGNFKAIIVQTKMCRDLLKGIFQKEYH